MVGSPNVGCFLRLLAALLPARVKLAPAIACVASVSVRFRSKERGTRVKDRAKNGHFHFLALVSFLAWPKPRIPFLGLSMLRNQTETLATQATLATKVSFKHESSL